jgi:hypothetical protein
MFVHDTNSQHSDSILISNMPTKKRYVTYNKLTMFAIPQQDGGIVLVTIESSQTNVKPIDIYFP